MSGRGWLLVAAVSAASTLTAPARPAAPSPLEARLTCAPIAQPGRVGCELEVETPRGRLVWADAVVVQAPELARPLRSRVVGGEESARGARRARLAVSLVATAMGRGPIRVRARGVVCPGAGARGCVASTVTVASEVIVGEEGAAKLPGVDPPR
ncbi:MAG: hypothetical protein IT376_05525 [Polyangiaceae bacterium]|nr:hypothetical protein [Polyangiaceae bacterium]